MSSVLFNIKNTPDIPPIAYYNKNDPDEKITGPTTYEQSTAGKVIKSNCINDNWNSVKGVFTKSEPVCSTDDTECQYKKDAYKALVKNDLDMVNYYTITDPGKLGSMNNDPDAIKNQIKYLSCQLMKARSRDYSSNEFSLTGTFSSIRDTFNRYPSLKNYLIIIFFITMYILIQGFFSSMDVGYNIATSLFRTGGTDVSYWTGILVGVAIPFIIFMFIFTSYVCKSLDQQNRLEITNNPFGTPEKVSASDRKMDIWMVVLFILFIYAFIGVLFTIRGLDKKMVFVVVLIVFIVFLVISVFLYIFYKYTPYIATGDINTPTAGKPRDLRLFIETTNDTNNITTNQQYEKKLGKAYTFCLFVLLFLALLFFYFRGKGSFTGNSGGGFKLGFTSAGAILILPLLWVFNLVIAMKYFFIYPVFIIMVRFVRYAARLLLYGLLNTGSDISDRIRNLLGSSYLEEMETDNMKNFSPSWNLIGIGFIKTWMNMCGMDNAFSKELVESSDGQKNISSDKYFSSLFIMRSLIKDDTKKNIAFGVINLLATLIIGSIILNKENIINTGSTLKKNLTLDKIIG